MNRSPRKPSTRFNLYVLSTFWQQSPKSQEKYNSVDRVVCLTHRTKYISQAYFISILIPHKRLPSSTALFSSRLDNQLRFKLLGPTPFIECKVNCFFLFHWIWTLVYDVLSHPYHILWYYVMPKLIIRKELDLWNGWRDGEMAMSSSFLVFFLLFSLGAALWTGYM